MILEHKLRNRVVIYGLKCVKLPKIDLPSYFFFVPLSFARKYFRSKEKKTSFSLVLCSLIRTFVVSI